MNPDAATALKAAETALKAFLQYVDIRDIHGRISEFRRLNFRSMSYREVHNAILDATSFDTPRGRMGMFQGVSSQYLAGTRFYRVRAIPKDDHVVPLRSMSKVGDCWEPPREMARIGRLNREGEPLLYTSPGDPLVAIEEAKIPDGERCSVIVYEAVEDVNVTVIGADPEVDGLDEVDLLKLQMIQGFLRDEFTRDVGRGTEYLYRISEVIAKDYFDFPPDVQDAWCYPSIADKKWWNVAFRPKDRHKLRLLGVWIAKPYRQGDGRLQLRIDCVVMETAGSDDLAYFRIGSPAQRLFFPEITQDKPQGVVDSPPQSE